MNVQCVGRRNLYQKIISKTILFDMTKHPEHICAFNDEPQSCDCYDKGYDRGVYEATTECVDCEWEGSHSVADCPKRNPVLKYCNTCIQMTNHDGDTCLKCAKCETSV